MSKYHRMLDKNENFLTCQLTHCLKEPETSSFRNFESNQGLKWILTSGFLVIFNICKAKMHNCLIEGCCSFWEHTMAMLTTKIGRKIAYGVNFYSNSCASTASELLCCCFASDSLNAFPWFLQTTVNNALGTYFCTHIFSYQDKLVE